jgi:uncharacterized membrane protein SpoIIM required for sporulation
MLDRFILDIEEGHKYVLLVPITFVITIILAFFNKFIGGNALFLVALVSLALSYPITSFARSMERKDIEEFNKSRSFFKRYEKELVLFLSMFLGVSFGLFASISFISDFSYQEAFAGPINEGVDVGESISGNAINTESTFFLIFMNNLRVIFLTFVLSFLLYSGLIFILVWNASVIVYVLSNFGSYDKVLIMAISILPHGFLEIAGYIAAGLAGAILSFRLDNAYSSKFYKVSDEKGNIEMRPDRRNIFNKILNKRLYMDLILLVFVALGLVFFGALIEAI